MDTKDEGVKLVKARVAPRRSVNIDKNKTAMPGEIVEFPQEEIDRMKAQGFVVDIAVETVIVPEGAEIEPVVKQTDPSAVTVKQSNAPKKGGASAVSSTIK